MQDSLYPAQSSPSIRPLELMQAISDEEICVYLQPKVDMKTGVILSCEALAKWTHVKHGMIDPLHFISLAERSALINDLTKLVMRKAFICLNAIQKEIPEFNLSVNLSANSLRDRMMAQFTLDLLSEFDIDPKCLELELTGSTKLSNPAAAYNAVKQLQSRGVNIAIDNYGSEFSTFSRIKALGVNSVKIHRQFVITMCQDISNYHFVKSTVELATKLGINSGAVGVENAKTFQCLKDLGCTTVQGHFIGEPVPSTDTQHIIETFMVYSAGALLEQQIDAHQKIKAENILH
ncbi:MAG: EAL domain-containing protein [Pseudomonadales bacterium]|nr:EAL domain-containing protein [Pseudomonadales bacterium]